MRSRGPEDITIAAIILQQVTRNSKFSLDKLSILMTDYMIHPGHLKHYMAFTTGILAPRNRGEETEYL